MDSISYSRKIDIYIGSIITLHQNIYASDMFLNGLKKLPFKQEMFLILFAKVLLMYYSIYLKSYVKDNLILLLHKNQYVRNNIT